MRKYCNGPSWPHRSTDTMNMVAQLVLAAASAEATPRNDKQNSEQDKPKIEDNKFKEMTQEGSLRWIQSIQEPDADLLKRT
ncbi:hypothetical protein [Klebsiella pneumoniae]|uniref:hypothetical protein n=1 Tax=Klebsiella pneumoniae TaxID=573 RepID=UPI003C13037A